MAQGQGFNNVVNSLVTFLSFGKVNPNLIAEQGDQNIEIARIQAEQSALQREANQKTLMVVGAILAVLAVLGIGTYIILKGN